ncbi:MULTISPECIES: ABC transporter permease [unclassified Bradyrhizobium]|uniref:ABC transporter permease n=1 Tax=unclassified Bradyrhizobium TaxID=2631580 RepID=UPI0028F09FA7|nr:MULTISPECIES: ABC transporter permease [unclassified Bradyrhizobium]
MTTAGLDRQIDARDDKSPTQRDAYRVTYFGAGRSQSSAALADLLAGLRLWHLWISLASLDVKQRYRRAVLGPFWITISMSILVLTLGTVYAGLFKQNVRSFLPYVAGGFIVWNFCTGIINDSTTAFVQAEGLIKQGGLPTSLHIFRTIFRNFIINAHNIVVMVLLYIWQPPLLNWHLLLVLPGLALMLMNFVWGAIIIAVLCTRFRDLPPIIGNVVQILFFVTPIMYRPETLPSHLSLFVQLNPFYYLMESVRAPLLGSFPPSHTYPTLLLLFVVGSLLTFRFYARTRGRIAYWL